MMTLHGHRFAAMLAENFDGGDLKPYFADEHYAVEQKFDGHRILLHTKNGEVTPFQRDGKTSQHYAKFQTPSWISNVLGFRGKEVVLDGELIDDKLHVFDVPYFEGYLEGRDPFERRRILLEALFEVGHFNEHLRLVTSVSKSDEKIEMFRRCLDQKAEGIIIKDIDSFYAPGRHRSMLKLKFTRTADLMIVSIGQDGKNSAEVAATDDEHDEAVIVGKVSLNGKEKVKLGDIVEVEYLYVGVHGRLTQPRMKFVRRDKAEIDTVDSLAKTDKRAVVSLE